MTMCTEFISFVKRKAVKYFFLSEGWNIGRVWEFGGLWDEIAWRRKPDIQKTNLCILEKGQRLWLYRVEDAVLMVEVRPTNLVKETHITEMIGQVVLKRLISADQAIELLCSSHIDTHSSQEIEDPATQPYSSRLDG
jgi:hypothetical protein